MKVVYWPSMAGAEITARLRAIPGIRLALADGPAAIDAEIADAEVLVIGGHFFGADVAQSLKAKARKLRFIQTFTAGYEGLQAQGVPPGVQVANAGDAWSPAVAEHGMAILLALVKRLPQFVAQQGRKEWNRSLTAEMGSLIGQTLVVVGFGSIGREFAVRARAFGMKIVGLTRSAKPDPLADEILPASSLHTALGRADVVLLAVPYSKATDRMMGAAEFAACKRGAILVNLARGGLVDQPALAAALQGGQLGGAATDVTEPEPLPAGDPFWAAPNLLITPHVAGANGPVGRERLAAHVAGNVARFIAGQVPAHLVTL